MPGPGGLVGHWPASDASVINNQTRAVPTTATRSSGPSHLPAILDPMDRARDDATEEAVIAALREAGASFALIHGSHVEGDPRPDSDLDVAAHWSEDPPAPWEVDLPHGVDLLVLNGAPLEIAGRIAHRGRLLFDDDAEARVRWQATTRKIWFDERPRFERAHREFLEAVRGR